MHVLALCLILVLMKKIRLFIVLILSITLPSLGLASVNLMAQCSTLTEMTTSSGHAAMAEMTDSPDDCMTQKSAMSSSGKQQNNQNCKFGANCNLSTILPSFTPLTLSSPYQDNALPAPETPSFPALEGQWRPPRSV